MPMDVFGSVVVRPVRMFTVGQPTQVPARGGQGMQQVGTGGTRGEHSWQPCFQLNMPLLLIDTRCFSLSDPFSKLPSS